MSERVNIGPNIKKLLLEKMIPTMKSWDGARYDYNLDSLIDPWILTDDIIESFIEIPFQDIPEQKKKRGYLTFMYPMYYLATNLRIIEKEDYFTFDRLKRILNHYIEYAKIVLEIEGSHDEFMYEISESDASDLFAFRRLSNCVIEKCTKQQRDEIEKMIDENVTVFLQHEFFDINFDSQPADLYFERFLQTYYPFSKEFVKKYAEYFLIEYIKDNPATQTDFDFQKVIFKNVLEKNLENHLKYYTNGKVKKDFTISEEEVDALILKYNID